MLIYRCDRCGREFNTKDLKKTDVFRVMLHRSTDSLEEMGIGYEANAHICYKCAEDFYEWISQPPERIKNDP